MGGDALATEEYWKITGDAGEGDADDLRARSAQPADGQGVVAEFKAQGYDPEGYTLYTYAAMQVFAEAATEANSTKVDDLAKAMRANRSTPCIGTIGFDAKGDVIGPDYVVYVWHDGKYNEISG